MFIGPRLLEFQRPLQPLKQCRELARAAASKLPLCPLRCRKGHGELRTAFVGVHELPMGNALLMFIAVYCNQLNCRVSQRENGECIYIGDPAIPCSRWVYIYYIIYKYKP